MKKLFKNEIGITLIALVITIIVLLILAAVSIATLTGKNGLLTKTSNAKEENRAASVEEAKNLWKTAKTVDEKTNTNTAQTLDELINDLENQKLITPDEKNTIKETGKVTIGNRTIIFEKIVALESHISVEDDGVYIVVNFKNGNYYIYAKNILEGKTQDEMMDMFVESEKYYESDYYEETYPGQEIDKDLVLEDYEVESLLELAENFGYDSIEELLIDWNYVKPEKFQSEEIEGEITDPDGKVVQVDRDTVLRYKITQNSTYTFLGKTTEGDTVKLDVTTNLKNECRLLYNNDVELWHCLLINVYGEKIDILEEYLPKIKVKGSENEIDLVPAIKDGIIALEELIWQLPSLSGEATIYLIMNGNRIEWNGYYDITSAL